MLSQCSSEDEQDKLIKYLENEVEKRKRALVDFANDKKSVFSRQRVDKLRAELIKNLDNQNSKEIQTAYKLTQPIRDYELQIALNAESKDTKEKKLVKQKQLKLLKRDIVNELSPDLADDDLMDLLKFDKKKIRHIVETLVKDGKICDKFNTTFFSLIKAFLNNENSESYVLVSDLHLESLIELQYINVIEFDESGNRVRLIDKCPNDDDDEDADSDCND